MNNYGEWAAHYTNAYGTMSEAEIRNNVYILARYFREQGWTDNAIAAMAGNMWVESYVNPGQWEGTAPVGSTYSGFGLVQWTPRTKYSEWAGAVWNYDWDFQLYRITYELNNGMQWINVGFGSFWQFAHSTDGLDYLTEAFVRSYERPADPDASLGLRKQHALTCWGWINGGVPPYSGSKLKKIILFKMAQNQSTIGKIKHWGGD